jgi:hypothetical protein
MKSSNIDEEIMGREWKTPCYISFYAKEDAQGGALRYTMYSERNHMDQILHNKANKKAKDLGARSWQIFKAWSMPNNIYYPEDDD